jgi:hypothetical protein
MSNEVQAGFFAPPKIDDLSSHLHRQLIGYLGLTLPLLLWLLAGWRPTLGLRRWQVLDSISAYYYTGAVAAFVGVLVALAVFFFTYRGYDNRHHRRDRIAAVVAAIAAIGVAFFPTGAPRPLLPPSWWTPEARTIHYISAAVLFGSFIFFALFLFPKSKNRTRNFLYYTCGAVMVVCMISAFFWGRGGGPIFWQEAIALVFFAISWLVKGRADWTLAAAGRRTVQMLWSAAGKP